MLSVSMSGGSSSLDMEIWFDGEMVIAGSTSVDGTDSFDDIDESGIITTVPFWN